MEASEFLALREGRVAGWKYAHTVRDLGELVVASGRLEASDPFVTLGEGITVEIPPGTYPVRVTIADVSDEQDGSHPREAYLSVVIADGEVARAELLTPIDAEPLDDEDMFYGVGVDAGTVGFADADAIARCMPNRDDSEGNWYEDVFDSDSEDSWFNLMDSETHLIAGAANIVMPKATAGENVVLCHSGWGDGFYPVVGTYDASGLLLGVHIDLEVDEKEGEPEAPETPGDAALDDAVPEEAAQVEAALGEAAGETATPPKRNDGFFARLFGRGEG